MNTSKTITFIGAGNLATSLAIALHAKGCNITQVFSRTKQAAHTLAQQIDAEPCTDLAQIAEHDGLYIYAVKDDALESVIDAVKVQSGLHAHTSGSLPMSVFAGKRTNYGVFYPFQTFTKEKPTDFTEIPIFVDANKPQNIDLLTQTGKSVSQNVYHLEDEDRKYLHLAGVFANNFSNSLYIMAAEILEAKHLPFEVLLPLIAESTAKLRTLPPTMAQTGPAARSDYQTIERQQQLLASRPDLLEVYNLLTNNIITQQKQQNR